MGITTIARDAIRWCATPADIERVFQRMLAHDGSDARHLLRACSERAYTIASSCKRGHLLAIRLDKGCGNSQRYRVAGGEYYTCTWGNGPGFRSAMADFEAWYEEKLREGGLRSTQKIVAIIDWVRCGYAWRALQLLGR